MDKATRSTERPAYYISDHVHWGLVDDCVVFLDVRHDKYRCLAEGHSATFRAMMNGGYPVGGSSPTAAKLMRVLEEGGLITRNPSRGRACSSPSIEKPTMSLFAITGQRLLRIAPHQTSRFFCAAISASAQLRFQSLERVIARMEARHLVRDGRSLNMDSLSELTRTFRTLRPAYPRRYLCRFDSLALLNFLAAYELYPQWVYGVRLRPFSAHCWVQTGHFVVNDYVENVCLYAPVMSI